MKTKEAVYTVFRTDDGGWSYRWDCGDRTGGTGLVWATPDQVEEYLALRVGVDGDAIVRGY